MRFLLTVVLAVTATLIEGCSRGGLPQRIILERTACFGWCPRYRITVNGDGRVNYDGVGYQDEFEKRLNPSMPLRDSMQVSPHAVRLVQQAFDVAFSQVHPHRLVPDRSVCALAATDHDTVRLVRETSTRRDTLELYMGCPVRPPPILRAAALIDSITDVAHWLGPRPHG